MREPVRRYEWAHPGDLIHVDVKKLGRIPDGALPYSRIHGRGRSAHHQANQRAKSAGTRAGYVYLHTAIDDHSRLAYTEELLDEKGATAAGFWTRAVKFFRRHGIRRIRRAGPRAGHRQRACPDLAREMGSPATRLVATDAPGHESPECLGSPYRLPSELRRPTNRSVVSPPHPPLRPAHAGSSRSATDRDLEPVTPSPGRAGPGGRDAPLGVTTWRSGALHPHPVVVTSCP